MSPRVVILQEYVPAYRVPFFEELRRLAEQDGCELVVAAGSPSKALAARNDVGHFEHVLIPQRQLSIFGLRVTLRKIRSVVEKADLIVAEQARRNLDTYWLSLAHRNKLALWGHGKDYTKAPSRFDALVLKILSRRAAHLFVYTDGGSDHLQRLGVPAHRITVVRNSTDTRALASRVAALDPEKVVTFAKIHDLRSRTALYIGGLDSSKKISLLIDAARLANSIDPNFRLLIGGDGPDRNIVTSALPHPALRFLGPLRGETKDLALASAHILAVPGRVGLVATDSIATGRPILTTTRTMHAPEFEYLDVGRTVFEAEDSAESYAEALLCDDEQIKSATSALLDLRSTVSIESMASRYWSGVREILRKQGLAA